MKLEGVHTLVLGSQLGGIQAFDVDIVSPFDAVQKGLKGPQKNLSLSSGIGSNIIDEC
jgi:hypothetical protein